VKESNFRESELCSAMQEWVEAERGEDAERAFKRVEECYYELIHARQAPAPVEVSRLAEALQLVRDLRRHLTDRETLKASVTLDELDTIIDRLAASTPVGEVPAGWKLMPRELTDEMIVAACRAGCWFVTEYSVKDVRAAYAAMLAVAEPAHVAKNGWRLGEGRG